MSKPPQVPKKFDPGVLQSMQEPIFLRVERRVGGASTPISLPAEDGMPEGFSKTRVESLESWLVTEWTGGGTYFFSASDSSNPPIKMEWISTFDTRVYPVRQPPDMAASAMVQMSSAPPMLQQLLQQPQPPQAQQVPMSSSPWPSGFQYASPPAPPVASGYSYAPPYAQPYAQPAQFTPFDRGSHAEKERLEREKQDLAARLAVAEKAAADEKHAREVEAVRRDSQRQIDELKASLLPKTDPVVDQRFSKLEAMMEKIVDRITTVPAPTGPSAELLAMQKMAEEANRRADESAREMRAATERAAAERAAADREASLRETMRQQEAALKAQLDTLAQSLIRMEQRPTGPDPTILMVKEMFRDQMQATTLQIQALQNQIMNPRDLIAITKESQSGVDEMRRNVSGLYNDMFGMLRQGVEMHMQMQPQGESPVVGMVKDGIQSGKEMVETIFGGRSKENIEAYKTQREIAKAQASVYAATGAASVAPPAVAASPIAANADLANQAAAEAAGGGLSGAAQPAQAPVQPTQNENVIPINRAATTNATATPAKRTDEEWFGPVLVQQVHALRGAVHAWLDSDGKSGMSPENCIKAIVQASGIIIKDQLPVPAFTDLLMQERYADFIDVLLPTPIPQTYRDAVMVQITKAMHVEEAADDDDDDDDDGAQADDGTEDAS